MTSLAVWGLMLPVRSSRPVGPEEAQPASAIRAQSGAFFIFIPSPRSPCRVNSGTSSRGNHAMQSMLTNLCSSFIAERSILSPVEALDRNCRQHIPRRDCPFGNRRLFDPHCSLRACAMTFAMTDGSAALPRSRRATHRHRSGLDQNVRLAFTGTMARSTISSRRKCVNV